MPDTDADLIAFLKSEGIYETIRDAMVSKDVDVGDVHIPSAGGDEDDGDEDEDDILPAMITETTHAEPDSVVSKALAADPVFAKGNAGLYVSRPLLPGSADRLHEWATAQGIPNLVPSNLMHVTQVHSVDDVEGLEPLSSTLNIATDGRWLSPLGTDGKALVMRIRSPEMLARFKEAQAAGAKWDFPYYQPHITLSYNLGDGFDWQTVDAPDFPIQLGPEVFQDNTTTWAEDNGLKKAADDFDFALDIAKVDAEKQWVFGWASVTKVNGEDVIDKQGDLIPTAEIEKAAYEFNLWSRDLGDMHEAVGKGDLIESMVFTAEKAAVGLIAKNERGEPVEGWWVGFHVTNPSLWDDHRSGRKMEFSIGGRATHIDA